MFPSAKVNGVWPFNDASLRTSLEEARRHATLPRPWIQRENWEFETHTRFLHDCRRTAARNLTRNSVPERVVMLLIGHKSRAIFDRDNLIHEQERLDADDQRVAYLAQQAHMVARAELNNLRWVSHCRHLVQLPVAA